MLNASKMIEAKYGRGHKTEFYRNARDKRAEKRTITFIFHSPSFTRGSDSVI
jgi:hypothetical protein